MPSTRPLHQLFAGFAALALLLAACAPPAAALQPTEAPQPTETPPAVTPAPPVDTPAPTPTIDPDQAVTSPPDLGTAEPDPYATDTTVDPWAPQPGDDALEPADSQRVRGQPQVGFGLSAACGDSEREESRRLGSRQSQKPKAVS